MEIFVTCQESNDHDIRLNYNFLSILVVIITIIINVSLIYFVLTISEERGGVLKYLANPIASRALVTKSTMIEGWSFLLALSSYGVSIITLSSILGGVLFSSNNLSHKIISFLPIISAMLISVFHFSRYSLIAPTLYWLLSTIYISYYLDAMHKKKHIKRIAIMVTCLFLLFFGLSFVIVSMRQFTDTSSGIEKIFIKQLYYYITGNVVGLDVYLKMDLPLEWGKGILRTVIRWFYRLGLAEKSDVLETKYHFVKISPVLTSNVFSYIRPLYEDFGVLGLLPLSSVWGYFSALSVNKYLDKFNFVRLSIACLFTFSLFMSFFGFHLLYISKILYELLLMIIVNRAFYKKLVLT